MKEKLPKALVARHTPPNYIWHLALSMQGLTTNNPDEINDLLETLKNTNGNQRHVHQTFHCDDSAEYTRGLFSQTLYWRTLFITKSCNN